MIQVGDIENNTALKAILSKLKLSDNPLDTISTIIGSYFVHTKPGARPISIFKTIKYGFKQCIGLSDRNRLISCGFELGSCLTQFVPN